MFWRAEAWIGIQLKDGGGGQSWSAHLDLAVVVGANGVDSQGSPGQVPGKPFESVGFVVEDG